MAQQRAETERKQEALEDSFDSKLNLGDQKPEQGGARPKISDDKPEQGGDKPEQGGARPKISDDKPEQGGDKPEQGGNKPEQGGDKPEQGGDKPEQGTGKPKRTTRVGHVDISEISDELRDEVLNQLKQHVAKQGYNAFAVTERKLSTDSKLPIEISDYTIKSVESKKSEKTACRIMNVYIKNEVLEHAINLAPLTGSDIEYAVFTIPCAEGNSRIKQIKIIFIYNPPVSGCHINQLQEIIGKCYNPICDNHTRVVMMGDVKLTSEEDTQPYDPEYGLTQVQLSADDTVIILNDYAGARATIRLLQIADNNVVCCDVRY